MRLLVGSRAEVSGCLVAPAVFKTDEAEVLGLAGSIPVRLRHLFDQGKRQELVLVVTIDVLRWDQDGNKMGTRRHDLASFEVFRSGMSATTFSAASSRTA
jgi:hypothetical protein